METSLHRSLKQLYADDEAQVEVPLAGYRIDAISGDQLIEIQHASLAAIRDKISDLLKHREVLVVKPVVVQKTLVKRVRKNGPVQSRRKSPKRGVVLDVFDELVYFTRVFPHPRLTLDVLLVDVEEWRYPGQGRRRRRRAGDFQVEDQKLTDVREVHRLRTTDDLRQLLPSGLPTPFHTGHLAEQLGVDRGMAQKIVYCFREMGAARQVGKQGNTRLYRWRKAS